MSSSFRARLRRLALEDHGGRRKDDRDKAAVTEFMPVTAASAALDCHLLHEPHCRPSRTGRL